MARKKTEPEAQPALVQCIESFSCDADTDSGPIPVVIRRGETVAADNELVRRYPHFFGPAGTPDFQLDLTRGRRWRPGR